MILTTTVAERTLLTIRTLLVFDRDTVQVQLSRSLSVDPPTSSEIPPGVLRLRRSVGRRLADSILSLRIENKVLVLYGELRVGILEVKLGVSGRETDLPSGNTCDRVGRSEKGNKEGIGDGTGLTTSTTVPGPPVGGLTNNICPPLFTPSFSRSPLRV